MHTAQTHRNLAQTVCTELALILLKVRERNKKELFLHTIGCLTFQPTSPQDWQRDKITAAKNETTNCSKTTWYKSTPNVQQIRSFSLTHCVNSAANWKQIDAIFASRKHFCRGWGGKVEKGEKCHGQCFGWYSFQRTASRNSFTVLRWIFSA